MRRTLFAVLFASTAFAMDPQRGEQVLREQSCLRCHNVRGQGGSNAPDLAVRLTGGYTPAELASMLWNHLPEMWAAIGNDRVPAPRPTARDAEDLFGFLYSSHFLNPPGTQARGERAFEQRGCAACHTAGPGTPVENWRGIRDPFALVQQMWNHAGLMRDSRQQRGVVFEKLSARDLSDITAFASKGAAKATPATLPETVQGEALFKSNCGTCHPAIVNLRKRLEDWMPAEVAAGLWNHAASMRNVPLLAPNDMRSIVGYVWNLQFQDAGDAVRGAKTFADKKCASCHAQMSRGERVYTAYSMISQGWVHGPLMQADIQKRKPRWPSLSADDIANLVAYMNKIP